MSRLLPALSLAAMVLLSGCKPAALPASNAPTTGGAPPTRAAAVVAKAASATAPEAEAPKPASPSLRIETFDGKTFDLAEHRGQWVVINFWATWCNPCLKEIPDLDAFDKSRKDVDVIGLDYEEIERADMQAFLKEHVISYPIAVVDVYKPPADFETPRGLPMTYLIAPDGKTARQFLGPVSSADLARAIAAAGAQKSSKSTGAN
jgi:thiol-disulfide isomerase/thioredoxin